MYRTFYQRPKITDATANFVTLSQYILSSVEKRAGSKSVHSKRMCHFAANRILHFNEHIMVSLLIY
jgi:hypothetical protein